MKERRRRVILVMVLALSFFAGAIYESRQPSTQSFQPVNSQVVSESELASHALQALQVQGRAPKTGYKRTMFGVSWPELADGCDARNLVLHRDLEPDALDEDGCKVLNGILLDPYTAKTINFQRGSETSSMVQIDHVVALSDAWQKGAQSFDETKRIQFANDPLNLLAVDGPINIEKGDGDSATWLPPNKAYRCQYVARQIAVKKKYQLWVTPAEHDAMKRILGSCPNQRLPLEADSR